jgi:ABC-type antimicrobial peptide transport system permease subunit
VALTKQFPKVLRSCARLSIHDGLAASIALSRVLEGTLFGVSALDPLTYAIASVLLLAVVAAASALPAWRATRVPAIRALRSE